uniref:Uncharacterized protein n=1 Tax=Tanacetum cinerariifolium TaxID=118510 RepID=A0A6L2NCX0_TANCI|nr:hypothetical protein [Tanacetum cinerariifolium]
MPLTFQSHSLKERPGLGIMKHTKPETQDSSNKSVSETVIVSEPKQIKPLVHTEVKDTEQESKLNELTKLVQMLIDEKILKAMAKPFPPCTHYAFNDHRPDDCRNYPECEIYGSFDHSTLGHNRVLHIKGGVLAESSQSNESLIEVKCNTCRSTIHSAFDHNEFDHFKRELTQENHVPEVIVPNEHDVPLTEDIEDPPDLINTKGTHEQNVQDDQRITQPTNVPSGNNTKASRPITEPLVPDVPQSHIPNQASTISHHAPHDRDQHIKLVNIIGNPGKA